MTPEEHESMAALETENVELRSEGLRLRGIAAERDALADEVARLQYQVKGLIECLDERKREVDRYRRPEPDHFDRG